MNYGEKCVGLARFALAEDGLDSIEQVALLAEEIQMTIEDYIADLDRRAHGNRGEI